MIEQKSQQLRELLSFEEEIQIVDIGAACINEPPCYLSLLEGGFARLHAFEGDNRHLESIESTFSQKVSIYPDYVFDGSTTKLYMTAPQTGMTSLLAPSEESLRFFNGFEAFGKVEHTCLVKTVRLDDIFNLPSIDFAKLDTQGTELTILQNGESKLSECCFLCLEVSFFPLYKSQPAFGVVDQYLRRLGFVPHCFLDIKRWSINPTIRDNNIRIPFNQLLEADIVYIKDPLHLKSISDNQLKKLIIISLITFFSYDLSVFFFLELIRRDPNIERRKTKVFSFIKNFQS